MQDSYSCDFCKKTFSRESTLFSHACEKRRRWLNKNEKFAQIGFYAYKRFFEINPPMYPKEITYRMFMDSKYYTSFTKFGFHVLEIDALDPLFYVEYLLKEGIPLERWTKDTVYAKYVKQHLKKESVEKAMERAIKIMEAWGKKHKKNWADFFDQCSPSLIVSLILTGKLSPWVLYNVDSNVFDRMDDDQLNMIVDYVNPVYWMDKFEQQEEDAKFVKNIMGAIK